MGYYNNWLVLFSIVGLAVQAGFAAMGHAESCPSVTPFSMYKNVSVMLVNK